MDLLQKIFLGGVIGAGGAGFPTHKKLIKNISLLLINAAECEPLLCSDKYIMRHNAKELISALDSIQKEMGIKRIVIGTKKKYTDEINVLQTEIKKQNLDIEIFCTKSFYPAGDEQALIFEVTGKTVPPGGIPIALGIVVINVTTLLNVYNALQGEPVVHRYVTVTGEVAFPCITHVPIGTSVKDCIQAAGGSLCEDYVIIMGGPMMGKYYDKDQLDSLYISKADSGIIILPADHYLPSFKQKKMEHILNQARYACIQCSYCTEQCPRYLIGHPLRPSRVMRAISTGTNAEDLVEASLCCECGVCEMYACPMGLSPCQVNKYIKNLLRENGVKGTFESNPNQTVMREYRRIDQSRLIARLNLKKYPTHLDNLTTHSPEVVRISLRQGIGKPSAPMVAVGDYVEKGILIGSLDFSDVGSMVHASISGKVISIENDVIVIEKEVGVH